MLIFVAFASAISGKTWKSLSKEKKLLALVRVEKSHFAGLLTSPSVVDKQTSSSAAGVVVFYVFLNKEFVRKCGWLTEKTVDSKISELSDLCY